MKIGLISDTHLSSDRLPQPILEVFREVDAILHAGDLVTLKVLRPLEGIAPVTAVQGNMDLPGVRFDLPPKTVIQAEGHRIGLIHGHRVPHPQRVLPPPIDFDAMHRYLLSEFQGEDVSCIVYGHTHQPHIGTYREVLMVNPGSATRGRGGLGTVGLLIVSPEQIQAQIVQVSSNKL